MTTTTSRRAILAGAAMLPAVSLPALAAPAFASDAFGPDHPDSELLRLGAELEQVEQAWIREGQAWRRALAAKEAACEAVGLPAKDPDDFEGERDEQFQHFRKYQQKRDAIWYEGKEEAEDEGDVAYERRWAVIEAVLAIKPQTLAGLAVLTRAVALSNSEWWNDDVERGRYEEGRAILYVESICQFLGIKTAPAMLRGEAVQS